MPELPEVDRVRQTLSQHVLGRRVKQVRINRPDIITGTATPAALLVGRTLHAIERHGKQLALLSESAVHDTQPAPCLCVHLGMTGQLQYHPPQPGLLDHLASQKHIHILWQLDDDGVMTFRDPRRFGGVWTFNHFPSLQTTRWAPLGPDALTITPKALHARLSHTRRAVKAALLDQTVVAGLGNIYVDESLFAIRLNPNTPACDLSPDTTRQLVRAFKAILRRAIASGGSTIRNYADGNGKAGAFQHTLRVYGRSGQPCFTCGNPLTSQTIIGRTTTLCQYCQRG
jgi:formamidopyrimidine-DNA glycosylase